VGLKDRARRLIDSQRVRPARTQARESLDEPTAKQVARTGFENGLPLNLTTRSAQVAATSERQQVLIQLHQAYLTCPWVSNPIDVISKTVTAGGLQLVCDQDLPEDQQPTDTPPVARLRRLLKTTNPREDMIQLLRSTVIDLLLFGDAYIEIVWLLGEPVALYTLDAPTMTVLSDAHGEVSGYSQNVDGQREAQFTPDEVIHISLDSPRGGLYGVGPAQRALLPVTAWLFTEATIKECFRRGDPPRLHVDLGSLQDTEVQRWREQYTVNNLGPKAVGTPVITTRGGVVTVLDPRKVTDYLDAEKVLRDQIISTFGVPPAKLGIIETGNIGGGSGESQDRTFRINTVIPIANLVLEKLNYSLLARGFQIGDWHLEFAEIDYRDSKIVEDIRQMRHQAGAYTTNDWRGEIGKAPIPGGDVAILLDRQGPVAWDDMEAMSKATIAYRTAPLTAAGVNGYVPGVPAALVPEPAAPVPDRIPDAPGDPEDKPGLSKDAAPGTPPEESAFGRDARKLGEAWQRSYRARRKLALAQLPKADEREKVGAGV
jgi:HK97 family phage portal protein